MIDCPPSKANRWAALSGSPAPPAELVRAAGGGNANAATTGNPDPAAGSQQERLRTRWKAAVVPDAAAFWARWSTLCRESDVHSAFQTVQWLGDWYATLGALPYVQPVLVRVYDPATNQDKLLLPLVRLRQSGLRILAPADLDVTDINGPLLQAGLHLSPRNAAALWQVLRAELSAHGDVLRLHKMPAALHGQANPLALALRCRPSPSVGYVFKVGDCWATWHRSLKRQARRESDRHWRIFNGYPQPQFQRITDPEHALRVFAQLEEMQLARLKSRGKYVLHGTAYRDFYRHRLVNGLKDGSVVMTAMTSGDELVAAAYGVRQGKTLTLLRVAFGGEQWKSCAPGRLIMEGTAKLMWEEGCRTFDLSIGSYAHKTTFGCTDYGLLELCTPLTWRGIPAALAWHAKHTFRPQLVA